MSSEEENLTKWRGRAYKAWAIVGACVLIGIILYVCGIIWQAVATVVVTGLAVFLLHGIVNRLEKRNIPRWAGTTIVFVAVTVIIVGCLLIVIPTMVSQLSSFIYNLPGYTNQLQDFVTNHADVFGPDNEGLFSSILAQVSNWLTTQAGSIISTLANGVIGGVISIGNIFIIAFVSLVCSFWILIDLPKMAKEARSLFSESLQDDIDVFSYAFSVAVYGWAHSTLICAIITGVASGLAFWACGIPYSSLLGFLCGILYLVPYIGPIVSGTIVALIALFVSPVTAIVSIVVNVIINTIVGNVISPKLMESSVSVHPAIILIAILVGGAVGGVAGMLLSIPVVAAFQGVFIAYFEAKTGKTITSEDGALFQRKKGFKAPKLTFDDSSNTSDTQAH